ncbi:OmpA family protein [candidate division CSSED10-310 bacterium]|uniref:OmpA family protein n=1 Tax=candidate division CSSED10-310 bacterium TaxID=2855610 RepID=A0ABV6Z4N2_UNCC1
MRKIPFFVMLLLGILPAFEGVYGEEEKMDFEKLLLGKKVILSFGLYQSGATDVSQQYVKYLNGLGKFLQENRELVIEIGGHTDNTGTTEVNVTISQKRAREVQEYIMHSFGILSYRLEVKGYASEFPIADNLTAEGRARNRRIEITPLKHIDPDGRVTYIRHDVFSKAVSEPDFKNAHLNEGLFHMDRVLTRQKSHASVTFMDQSKIALAPKSLMVMYARNVEQKPVSRKTNVELLTGGLRTKLKKLRGDFQVETPSSQINADSVEIQVDVDPSLLSAISVYDGLTKVSAVGVTVAVPKGYGTTVQLGQEPAPPEPLPPPAQLLEPLEATLMLPPTADTTDVEFMWIQVEKKYKLQIATTSEFDEILQEEYSTESKIILPFGLGTYHWRLAAKSESGLEGFAAQSSFTITEYREPADLPWELALVAVGVGAEGEEESAGTIIEGDVVRTIEDTYPIAGKTAPGTQITVNDEVYQLGADGTFECKVSLNEGWNDINIKAHHPDYKEHSFHFVVIYRNLWGTAPYIIFKVFHAVATEEYVNNACFQIGTNLALGPFFEGELSAGVTELGWDETTGDYGRNIWAIPVSGELHLMLRKKFNTPYLSLGLTGYFAFPRRLSDDSIETEFFLSPELGIGYAFPTISMPFKMEVKYACFPENKPFNSDVVHGFLFNFKVRL